MQTPEQVYDLICGEYDKSLETPAMRFYQAVTWENIKGFLPENPDSITLDIAGCTGIWSIQIAKEGKQVVLGDISQGMLNVARDKLKDLGLSDLVDVQRLDICDMSRLADDSFDLVLCQGDALCYSEDPVKAVSECFRVTKPGGYFIPSVLCRFRWATRLASLAEWDHAIEVLEKGIGQMSYTKGTFGIHGYTPHELIELLESVGWEVGNIYGKTVLGSLLPEETLEDFVANPQRLHRLVQVERMLGAEPSLIGIAGRIEAVCRKPAAHS